MKKIKHALKLSLPAGNATPTPPVSTTLGLVGVNMTQFCCDFNSLTFGLSGNLEIGVLVYDDLSYNIVTKKELEKYQQTEFIESMGFLYKNEHQENKSSISR